MKILVISLAGIGDTLMATPLIHELRLNYPEATLDAFVMWPGARDILEGSPHLSAVFQRNIMREGMLATWRFAGELRQRGYALSFNTYPQSRLEYRVVARLIGARRRISHQYGNSRLLDRCLVEANTRQDYGRHAVENNLALLEAAGGDRRQHQHAYELFPKPAETDWAAHAAEAMGLKGRRVLGVHVGSGRTKNLELRRWPLDLFVELFRRLLTQQPDLSVLLFGGPEEQEDHALVRHQVADARIHAVQAPGLRHTAALLARCHAFLSVDTVLMHLAAAMRVPRQVVIETMTFNKTVEPYGQDYVLVPNPRVAGRNLDFYRYDGGGIKGTPAELEACMRSVTVDAVQRAVEDALQPRRA